MKLSRAIGVFAAMATLTFRAIAKKPLPRRLAADQRRIWSFPATAVRGDAWKPSLGVIGVTAAVIALDPMITPWMQQDAFQRAPVVRRINRILSGRHTAAGINAAWSLCWVAGIVRRNSCARQTGLLAGEAVLGAQILAISLKHVNRRMRPAEVGPAGDFTRTWFRTRNRNIDGAGCFPSGHTASAFAIAAVFAERYPKHRWLAFVVYGLAGIVAASRLSLRAHFPSDVFLGATLGYSISHFVVLRREAAVTAQGHLTADS